MVTLTSSSFPIGGRLTIQKPNTNSPFTSLIFYTRRKKPISNNPHGNYSRNNSLIVKSQYLTPRESEPPQQQFYSYDTPRPHSPRPLSPSSQAGKFPSKVFAGYTIYKGKAALTVDAVLPVFTRLENAVKVSKEGYVILQFAPVSVERQYDWSRKQVFSLSVEELGSIISLGARESLEFFHDPHKGRNDEGKVRKFLKIDPFPEGTGRFFNLSVQNRLTNVDENITIPITKAELAVLVSLFNFIVPVLLGWHTAVNIEARDYTNHGNNASPKYGVDYEWSR